ncbi:MAG: hypothetical protein IPL18_11940 [Sphingomonadales bacterium]|nr:hypothetical protein [Sphingomonadales bacterium]
MRESAIILALRLATLVLRFGLTLYVTAFIGLEATGTLGIAIALTAITPALIGFGLNYHLTRDVVGQSLACVIPMARDRALVTFAALILLTVAGVAAHWQWVGPPGLTEWLIVALVWFEMLALEHYLLLIGLQRSVMANVMIFVRSAVWVPAAMLFGYLAPEARSIDMVLAFWVAGHAAALALFAGLLVREHALGLWLAPRTGWVGTTMRHSWLIWISDIALAGMAFSDRLIVAQVLDTRAVGVFTLYWSFANAMQTLITSAFIQPALPGLVLLHRNDPAGWKVHVFRRWRLVTLLAIGLGMAIIAAIYVLFSYAPPDRFPWEPTLALLLFAAYGVRIGSEYLGICLTSAGRFNAYALSTIGGFAVTFGLLWGLTKLGGINGTAQALLFAAVGLTVVRLWLVRREPGELAAKPQS